MKSRSILPGAACLALAAMATGSAIAQTDPSSWRPVVYDQVYWNIPGSFQGTIGSVPSAYKTILMPDGSGQDKKLFYSVRLQGAKINGVDYQRSEISGSDYTDVQPTYYRFWGDYRMGPWTVRSEFIFHKSGEFEFKNSFVGSQPSLTGTEIYLRIDHDVGYMNNNIIELALGAGWYANETSFNWSFAARNKATDRVVQNNAYFRIAQASAPQDQFYAVFWPSKDASRDNSPFTLTVLPMTSDPETVPPTAANLKKIQDIYSGATMSNYAWGSNNIDQVMYLALRRATDLNYYGIAGKVFQKPQARTLQVHMHVESGVPTPLPDSPVRQTGRTMNQAFNELTDGKWSYHVTTGRVKNQSPSTCSGGGRTFTNCYTPAQLHDLMTDWRGQSNAYTPANRNNYQDWRVDVSNIEGRYSNDPAKVGGVMFDHTSDDLNGAPREGAILFWTTLADPIGGYGANANATLPYVLLHEVGHAFNARHAWVEVTPTSQSIMYQDGFEDGKQTMQWETWTRNFFRNGPESWVKPGKYGSLFLDGAQGETKKPYKLYGSGQLISP